MTVGRKFALTGAGLMALSAVLSGVGIYGLTHLTAKVDSLAFDAMPGLAISGEIEAALNEYRGDVLKHIGTNETGTKLQAEGNLLKLRELVRKSLRDYTNSVFTEEDRANYAAAGPAIERYFEVCDGVLVVSRSGQKDEAYQKYENESIKTGIYRAAKAGVHAMTKQNKEAGVRYAAEAGETLVRVRSTLIGLLAFALVAGSISLWWIVKSVNKSLHSAASALESGAAEVASASGQIADWSQALTKGAIDQAASLEETAASGEEINSMARRNSENAEQASKLVTDSETKFEQANQTLEETVGAMDEIENQSAKIAKIIKVIDEIAFQTNILALNAAVEDRKSVV